MYNFGFRCSRGTALPHGRPAGVSQGSDLRPLGGWAVGGVAPPVCYIESEIRPAKDSALATDRCCTIVNKLCYFCSTRVLHYVIIKQNAFNSTAVTASALL
jgi:hypothetical protein